MDWKTKMRLKDTGALGLIGTTTGILIRTATKSDGALARARRNAAVGASAGATIGGVIGFANDKTSKDNQQESIEETATHALVGGIGGAAIFGFASLVWDAMHPRRRRRK